MNLVSIQTLQTLVIVAARSGKFFGVTFEKRSNGEERHMICRGRGETAEKTASKGLLTVWENQMSGRLYGSAAVSGFRTIPLEGVTSLRFGGVQYILRSCVKVSLGSDNPEIQGLFTMAKLPRSRTISWTRYVDLP
jgi:hypothetical protein